MTTEHCPDHTTAPKVEGDSSALVLPAGTSFCVKASTTATPVLVADGSTTLHEYLVQSGVTTPSGRTPAVSYYVTYSTASPSPSPSASASASASASPTGSPSPTPSDSTPPPVIETPPPSQPPAPDGSLIAECESAQVTAYAGDYAVTVDGDVVAEFTVHPEDAPFQGVIPLDVKTQRVSLIGDVLTDEAFVLDSALVACASEVVVPPPSPPAREIAATGVDMSALLLAGAVLLALGRSAVKGVRS